ncbi:Mu-like prophage major head subunit gpT family protein [Vulcaniibacterium tengchongense]|uniref:Phage major head subunit gpT-like protein n=1 Tax=Vulcaniibacterium tengchongense TaxID=1273429 RepID=A0A3N4VRK0_9GAMM|nr:Mu-like prophage major head subunit gpT family protein [Vulcaniibacterium tengchongense]RPE81841.1 phage major head subunit gpT-like protein [Vulcaniibacterium tengchongense]
MALVTSALVQALFVGFRRDFQTAFDQTPTDWQKIATEIPSTTKSNTYGWLGQFPQFREWIGPRVLKDMAAHGYSIVNKDWESSVSVKRTDIEDDNVGIYSPLFAEMGRAAKSQPDELVFPLLKAGFSTLCYDGQPFFDDEHPVYANADGTGAVTLVKNHDVDLAARPTNPIWYLLDTSRAVKPIIFQNRKSPVLTSMTRLDDEAVFMNNEFRFGVDARNNVGFGFWQLAYASNQPLTAEHYADARAAMQSSKADGGRPLNIRPNLLLVPPALEAAGRKLLVKDENGGNEWANSAELVTSNWLV